MLIDRISPKLQVRRCGFLWRKWCVVWVVVFGWDVKTVRLSRSYKSYGIARQRLLALRRCIKKGLLVLSFVESELVLTHWYKDAK